MKEDDGYIAALDGIRAVAILLVVLHHWNSTWMPNGWLGVDLFFVLSGYLISRRVLLKLVSKTFSLTNYLKTRALRILPAYYFVLIINYISLSFRDPLGFNTAKSLFIKYITFIVEEEKNWFGYGLGVLWSLRVEMWFYLAWPLLLLWVMKKPNWLKSIFFLGVVLFPLFVRIIFFGGDRGAYTHTVTRFDSLFVGALLAMAEIKFSSHYRKLGRWARVITWSSTIGLVASLLLAKMQGVWTNVVGYPTVALTGAGLILGTRLNEVKTLLSRWLESRPLVFIGRISYGIYLVHGVLLDNTRAVFHNSFRLFFFVSLVLAILMNVFVERPFVNWGKYGRFKS